MPFEFIFAARNVSALLRRNKNTEILSVCHLTRHRAQNVIRDFRAILRRKGVVKSLWIRRIPWRYQITEI